MSSPIVRRTSTPVHIGPVTVGGGHPVVVQSMTNTDTADVDATVAQVAALYKAGSQIVRITVDRDEVIEFASKYDPQPFHLDEDAAAKSMFGKLSASGWKR